MKDWNKIIEFANSNVNNHNFVNVFIVMNYVTNEINRVTFFNKEEANKYATYLTIKYNQIHKVVLTCAQIK